MNHISPFSLQCLQAQLSVLPNRYILSDMSTISDLAGDSCCCSSVVNTTTAVVWVGWGGWGGSAVSSILPSSFLGVIFLLFRILLSLFLLSLAGDSVFFSSLLSLIRCLSSPISTPSYPSSPFLQLLLSIVVTLISIDKSYNFPILFSFSLSKISLLLSPCLLDGFAPNTSFSIWVISFLDIIPKSEVS